MSASSFVHPMTLREIFKNAWVLYRRHFGIFFTITLVYVVIFYPLDELIRSAVPGTAYYLANLLAQSVYNFAYAATLVATSNAVLGRPIKVLDSYRRVFTPRILLIMLIFSLPFQLIPFLNEMIIRPNLTQGGATSFLSGFIDFIVLPVIAVAIHTMLLFRAPVAVLEKRTILDTFERVVRLFFANIDRKTLSIGFTWKLLYFWLMLTIPTLVITPFALAYVLIYSSQPNNMVIWLGMRSLEALFELLVSPYSLLLSILLYYDIRARKEAYNELVLAEEMGYQPFTELITA